MSEINDYLSKADKDLAKSVMYRVYGMPGPLFVDEDEEGGDTPEPGPEPSTNIPFYVENITEETETIKFNNNGGQGELRIKSSNNKTDWVDLGILDSSIEVVLAPGDRLYIRGIFDEMSDPVWGGDEGGYRIIGMSKVGGNIMSLIYGDEFNGQTEFPGEYSFVFSELFYAGSSNAIVDASELILPATTLSWGCYRGMFGECSHLTAAPQLPATTLGYGCYETMFSSCTSLTKAPELPATTLVEHCYNSMFYNCPSLNEITIHANDISAEKCLNEWLVNVAETGTFHNLGTATYDEGSGSGIPSGWTEVHE